MQPPLPLNVDNREQNLCLASSNDIKHYPEAGGAPVENAVFLLVASFPDSQTQFFSRGFIIDTPRQSTHEEDKR